MKEVFSLNCTRKACDYRCKKTVSNIHLSPLVITPWYLIYSRRGLDYIFYSWDSVWNRRKCAEPKSGYKQNDCSLVTVFKTVCSCRIARNVQNDDNIITSSDTEQKCSLMWIQLLFVAIFMTVILFQNLFTK